MYYHSRFALQKTSKVIFKLAYDYIHFVSISLKISSYRMSINEQKLQKLLNRHSYFTNSGINSIFHFELSSFFLFSHCSHPLIHTYFVWLHKNAITFSSHGSDIDSADLTPLL